METTELVIKVIINHENDVCKQQAIDSLCEGIKEGFSIEGMNGYGKRFDLKVTEMIETSKK